MLERSCTAPGLSSCTPREEKSARQVRNEPGSVSTATRFDARCRESLSVRYWAGHHDAIVFASDREASPGLPWRE